MSIVTPAFQVCELHFRQEDIEWETSYYEEKSGRTFTAKLHKPRLRKDAVPSVLPNCPSYLSASTISSRESPDSKRCRREEAAIQNAIDQSVVDEQNHSERNKFTTLSELRDKLNALDKYWTIDMKDESLLIGHFVHLPKPKIRLYVVIDLEFHVHVFINDTEVQWLGKYRIPSTINELHVLEQLLNNLRKCDTEESASSPDRVNFLLQFVISILIFLQDESPKNLNTLKVICEQLRLMTLPKKEYSPDFMIFSSLLHNCSPQGYKFLRSTGYLILPSYSTVRRLTVTQTLSPATEQHDSNFLMYIKNKFNFLLPNDKYVTLMIDEIHIKPYFDYKGGTVVGSAFDSNHAATSAFVFMVNSVCSVYKDVAHIMPTKSMTAENLYSFIKKILIGLEDIGFRVICVLTDNNAINKKAMSHFTVPPKLSIVYPHPADSSRPLFFMFDSVHLLKCIRNNWLGQKDLDKCMKFPSFCFQGAFDTVTKVNSAPFTTLKRLHYWEADSLLKHAYGLTLKSLTPSNLEKQNVKLVLQIFNEYVIQALETVGVKRGLPFAQDVADYIKIIYVWWTIMNVKSAHKGTRLNNKYATPLTNDVSDENYVFLNNFCNWLDLWNSMTETSGKLTKETFTALRHTTHAIIEITNYCINELNLKYVLTGKLQTDQLEARFGKYRRLAGCNYNISVRQVFECEKKLRLMSVLSIPFHNKSVELNISQETNWDKMNNEDCITKLTFDLEVTQDDIEKCTDVLPVITYLAGYCCYAVSKKTKCSFCQDIITCDEGEENISDNHSYIQGINRGSLLHPDEAVVNIIMYNYIVVNKLTQRPEFLKSLNQRSLATDCSLNALTDNDVVLLNASCNDGHSTENTVKMLLWASSNTLLNNYCARENDRLNESRKLGKKRKLQTLTK